MLLHRIIFPNRVPVENCFEPLTENVRKTSVIVKKLLLFIILRYALYCRERFNILILRYRSAMARASKNTPLTYSSEQNDLLRNNNNKNENIVKKKNVPVPLGNKIKSHLRGVRVSLFTPCHAAASGLF